MKERWIKIKCKSRSSFAYTILQLQWHEMDLKWKKYVKIKILKMKKKIALLDGVESDLDDVIDRHRTNQTQSFYLKKEDILNLKTFWSLKETFTSLKIEGKIKSTVMKRVKKTELMFLKQKKNLKDSQEKRKKERERRKEMEKRRLRRFKFPWIGRKRIHQAQRDKNLSAEMTHPVPDNHAPFDIFSVVTNLNPLLKLLVEQSNHYA